VNTYNNMIIFYVSKRDLYKQGNLNNTQILKRNFVLCNLLVSGNACYRPEQNLSSSRFLSKNMKINEHGTIILSVVLCGCKTWSLKLKEERRLRVFENRVLRRTFGPKRDEVTGE